MRRYPASGNEYRDDLRDAEGWRSEAVAIAGTKGRELLGNRGSARTQAWLDWCYPRWVAATAALMVVLLLYSPFICARRSAGFVLIFLFGPAYMAHQIEEHAGDRFRQYVNTQLFGGRDALTPLGVLVINLPGVWGLNLLSLYAAGFCGSGWGLAAPYLAIVNALAHVATGLRFRGYNPGLATSALLFLPIGLFSLANIPASAVQHAVGLGIAIVVHAAIIIHIVARDRRLAAA